MDINPKSIRIRNSQLFVSGSLYGFTNGSTFNRIHQSSPVKETTESTTQHSNAQPDEQLNYSSDPSSDPSPSATSETSLTVSKDWLQSVLICLWNSRSLLNKIKLFHSFVYSSHQIFAVTESWCSPDVYNNELFPPYITVYRKDRNSKGAVSFLVFIPQFPLISYHPLCLLNWFVWKYSFQNQLSFVWYIFLHSLMLSTRPVWSYFSLLWLHILSFFLVILIFLM